MDKLPNIEHSENFFEFLKENQFEKVVQLLSNTSKSELISYLSNDTRKTIFWTNVYNVYFQFLAQEKQEELEQNWAKFFTKKQLNIAGQQYSFNDVEHRFLRKSKLLYGLGYLNSFKKITYETDFRVEVPDHRIHFILNCGANSCPPIQILKPESFESTLQNAESTFIQSESSYCEITNTLSTSSIFLMYFGDFAGRNGIIRLHRKHGINPNRQYTKINYQPFDKGLKLKHYIS